MLRVKRVVPLAGALQLADVLPATKELRDIVRTQMVITYWSCCDFLSLFLSAVIMSCLHVVVLSKVRRSARSKAGAISSFRLPFRLKEGTGDGLFPGLGSDSEID